MSTRLTPLQTGVRTLGAALWLLAALLFLFWLAPHARAQQNPVTTLPYLVNSTNASTTIAVTDTFQIVFAAPTGQQKRAGCTIINYGTHTMWVFFGKTTDTPVKTSSVQLSTGQRASCNVSGLSLQDQVWITGTSGDAFFAAQQ